MIVFIERTYPHIATLVLKPNKSDEDRMLLSAYGRRGNASPKRKKAQSRGLPLFAELDLDPSGEFPEHRVLYRGPNFSLLEKKRGKKSPRIPRDAPRAYCSQEEFDALCAELYRAEVMQGARSHAMQNLAGVRAD